MATQTDLWGDWAPAEVRTPLSIMREQATLLGRKTKNLLEALVDTSFAGETFRHSFRLVVPALNSYTYELFIVEHGVSLYPVDVWRPGSARLQTEDEFIDWLRNTLSSAETRKLIGNLLAQARS